MGGAGLFPEEDTLNVAAGSFADQLLRAGVDEPGHRRRPHLNCLEVNGASLTSVQLRKRTFAGVWSDLGPPKYPDGDGWVRFHDVGPDSAQFTTDWPGRREQLGFTTAGAGNQSAYFKTSLRT